MIRERGIMPDFAVEEERLRGRDPKSLEVKQAVEWARRNTYHISEPGMAAKILRHRRVAVANKDSGQFAIQYPTIHLKGERAGEILKAIRKFKEADRKHMLECAVAEGRLDESDAARIQESEEVSISKLANAEVLGKGPKGVPNESVRLGKGETPSVESPSRRQFLKTAGRVIVVGGVAMTMGGCEIVEDINTFVQNYIKPQEKVNPTPFPTDKIEPPIEEPVTPEPTLLPTSIVPVVPQTEVSESLITESLADPNSACSVDEKQKVVDFGYSQAELSTLENLFAKSAGFAKEDLEFQYCATKASWAVFAKDKDGNLYLPIGFVDKNGNTVNTAAGLTSEDINVVFAKVEMPQEAKGRAEISIIKNESGGFNAVLLSPEGKFYAWINSNGEWQWSENTRAELVSSLGRVDLAPNYKNPNKDVIDGLIDKGFFSMDQESLENWIDYWTLAPNTPFKEEDIKQIKWFEDKDNPAGYAKPTVELKDGRIFGIPYQDALYMEDVPAGKGRVLTDSTKPLDLSGEGLIFKSNVWMWVDKNGNIEYVTDEEGNKVPAEEYRVPVCLTLEEAKNCTYDFGSASNEEVAKGLRKLRIGLAMTGEPFSKEAAETAREYGGYQRMTGDPGRSIAFSYEYSQKIKENLNQRTFEVNSILSAMVRHPGDDLNETYIFNVRFMDVDGKVLSLFAPARLAKGTYDVLKRASSFGVMIERQDEYSGKGIWNSTSTKLLKDLSDYYDINKKFTENIQEILVGITIS